MAGHSGPRDLAGLALSREPVLNPLQFSQGRKHDSLMLGGVYRE
jgi:hypothetical protein